MNPAFHPVIKRFVVRSWRAPRLFRAHFFLLISLLTFQVSAFSPAFAASDAAITASLKNSSTVIRSDAKTGSYQGSISVSNAIAVGCDGTTIAVLSANYNVTRYDARTGSYQGSKSAGAKATSVQVTGGVIIVQKDRTLTRYDAKTVTYLGSSSQ
ncbi:MAG: hypothetical protein ACOYM3_11525 [Terrimicrobiaceae bacterium]